MVEKRWKKVVKEGFKLDFKWLKSNELAVRFIILILDGQRSKKWNDG